MFKIFRKKKVESPVDFVDVAGYGSARVKPKAQTSSNITSDGYFAVPAPSDSSSPLADDMGFLGAMANASSALNSQSLPSQQSSPYPSSINTDDTYKILRKLEHLSDKLDLMEKKISRIERKTGISFDEL